MSTQGVAGQQSRIDRLLGKYADGLLERKKRLEAVYFAKRAGRAERSGNLDAAETFYGDARTIRGRLGDREESIDLGLKHATVAHENGNLATASKQFQRVVELHARRENAKGALDALEPMLDILETQGRDDDLREWWGHAMMVIGKAEPGEISDERRASLIDQYAAQMETEDSGGRIYGFALDRFLADNDEGGADLLQATWDRREVTREAVSQFRVVLAAGVGLVAYAELSDRDVDREEILDYVADHRERLSEAATALFEHLSEGETDTDAEDLRTGAEAGEERELREVEAEVFGRFLGELE